MTTQEKLRELLESYARDEHKAEGDHLHDEDFIRLIGSKTMDTGISNEQNGDSVAALADEYAPLRRHLAGCDSCLADYKDFYAFFAPAAESETVAEKKEINSAWQNFAPRINQKQLVIAEEKQPNFLTRLFSREKRTNFSAAFGWAFAALLLLLSGFSLYVAFQARNEQSQLTAELENQKQVYEERLKKLQQTGQQTGDLAEQEKSRLAQEKEELEKQIAGLQTEIERANRQKETRENIPAPSAAPSSPNRQKDDTLVAVNTPIYDVFPSDATVRSGTPSQNNFAVPSAAKNIVLILNAAGRAEFPAYQAELLSNTGKIIWRGSGLKKDNLGNFTITLSRAALKKGNYRLRLFSGSQTVAEYPIAIEIK